MRALILILVVLATFTVGVADTLEVRAPDLRVGDRWTVLELNAGALPVLMAGWEQRTFWDLRFVDGRLVEWSVVAPIDAGLAGAARVLGADRALCATERPAGTPLGCSLFRTNETGPAGPRLLWSDASGTPPVPTVARVTAREERILSTGSRFASMLSRDGDVVRRIAGRAVAEGVAVLPAGPREVVVLRESIEDPAGETLRYRFATESGHTVAEFEGAPPAPGSAFLTRRASVLVEAEFLADDGMEISYAALSAALVPGTTGILQYSLPGATDVSLIDSSWTTAADVVTPVAGGTIYQPDPGDPSSAMPIPESWDFTALDTSVLTFRTFNSTRDDALPGLCLEDCASRDVSPTPPDGTWQVYLKADKYDGSGTFSTHNLFELNDNDTGVDPSIDMVYVNLDSQSTDDQTQICFEESPGNDASNRLHRFVQFTGPNASAVAGVGDTWTTGDWSGCSEFSGLHVGLASVCDPGCLSQCGLPPYAQGQFDGNAGLRMTVAEDGFIHVAAGNFLPAMLVLQETDILGGRDFIATCLISPTPLRSFDYFWISEEYGLLAFLSSQNEPEPTTPENWTIADGGDFIWGPFPPYQTEAEACLSGTLVSWALPADGSNLSGEPNITGYGYVVSWGSATDPEDLADWTANPNHTPLPGEPGYLLAPSGGEPTSTIITGWPGSSINATVITALDYTDPDAADTTTYRAAALYKVMEDPARLDPGSFLVGDGVVPLVTRSGSDLDLAWPAVAGAAAYRIRVWDLATRVEIACPAGLDCDPSGSAAVHSGGAVDGQSYGYQVFSVDACGEASAN